MPSLIEQEIGERPDAEAMTYAEQVLTCKQQFSFPSCAPGKGCLFMRAATYLMVDAYEGRAPSSTDWSTDAELNRHWQTLYEALTYFARSRRETATKCVRVLAMHGLHRTPEARSVLRLASTHVSLAGIETNQTEKGATP